MFVARFLIICLPPALLLFGEGLTLVSPKPLHYSVLAIVLFGSLLAVRSFYRQPSATEWKPAIMFLAQNAAPGDVLVFANPYCSFPFDYNLRTLGIRFPRVTQRAGDVKDIREFSALAQHIWVVDFSMDSHRFWSSLPVENGEIGQGPTFFFRRTLRFRGVDVQQFDRDEQRSQH